MMRLRNRLYTLRHKAMAHALSGVAPYRVVNEFPKSGGTWLTLMLSDALDLPFRRNEPLRIEPALVHGHFLRPGTLRNVVVLWRDPRDLIVSLYHHCFFVSEFDDVLFGNRAIVARMRGTLPFKDYDDVRANLPAFIRFISETPVVPRFTWPRFVDRWAGRAGTVQTHYEALRADTPAELARVVTALTGTASDSSRMASIAEARSFPRAKAEAERHLPKGARSFVRSGSVGGWRDSFNDEAHAMLTRYGYDAAMRKLGYQPHSQGLSDKTSV